MIRSKVASGINPGPNLGVDFYLSGTCGAALMGAFRGVTSIAVSQDAESTGDGQVDLNWDTSQAVMRLLAAGIEAGTVPEGALLNVNAPARPAGEVEGDEIGVLAGAACRLERVHDPVAFLQVVDAGPKDRSRDVDLDVSARGGLVEADL